MHKIRNEQYDDDNKNAQLTNRGQPLMSLPSNSLSELYTCQSRPSSIVHRLCKMSAEAAVAAVGHPRDIHLGQTGEEVQEA